MTYGLSHQQLSMIVEFLSTFPAIEKAFIFGSRALGTYKKASDIDIAILGERANTALASHIRFYLEEETNLPYFCDIVAFCDIDNEALKRHIEVHGKLIYSAHA